MCTDIANFVFCWDLQKHFNFHLGTGGDRPEIFPLTAKLARILAELGIHAIVHQRQEDLTLTGKILLPKRYWEKCKKSSQLLRLHSYNN
jgi:hypothetical protein